MKKIRGFLTLLFLGLSLLIYADEREEPIDIIIALDKSLSMVEEIEAVKEYVNTFMIDQLLIPGDYFLVVTFYGQTEIPVSMRISSERDKERAKETIAGLMADGRFTDIGNALDKLGEQLDKFSDSGRKKYLLLITDGIQEAPPESKYYSPDGSFNHAFLENTKTIQKKGWKIHVLGIGTYHAAQELARELSGKYTEISEEPTSKEIAEKTKDFLSSIELAQKVKFSGLNQHGRGTLKLRLVSKGYTEVKEIVISAIQLLLPGRDVENILAHEFSISLQPDGSETARLPIHIQQELESGDYSGTIQFFFAGEEQFIPAVMEVQFHVKSFLGNYWIWILIGIILLVILIILLILLISRLGKARVRFRLIVEDQTLSKEEELFTLREGKFLFLNELNDIVSISNKRNPKSLAKLSIIQKKLRMTLLKESRFLKLREVPKDVLDFNFRIRAESGKNINVGFGSLT